MENKKHQLIPISEMATLHGLTRPTLLYYDSIDLFKPVWVDANGYRYYSRMQIPVLREICFLKSLGIPLKEIQGHIRQRSPKREMQLLEEQEKYLQTEIVRLQKKREALQQRIYMYHEAVAATAQIPEEPFFRKYKERKLIFAPFEENMGEAVKRETIHLTLMKLWRAMYEHEDMPAYSYGNLYSYEGYKLGNLWQGAGCYIRVPNNMADFEVPSLLLPAGEYVCLYTYGVPTDLTRLYALLEWIKTHGYKVNGHIVDACFLDSTFDEEMHDAIFSMLQVPVQS